MEDQNLPTGQESGSSTPSPTPAAPPPLPPPPLLRQAPPLILSSTPPPAKPGRGWKVIALILGCLLAVILFFNLKSLVTEFAIGGEVGGGAGSRLMEVTMEARDGSDKIAVLDVKGIIMSASIDGTGSSMAEFITAQLKKAAKDDKVKAVVLRVDSPGGEVLASDDIYRAIEKFERDSKKPVIASMGGLAASGGYYVSAPCRWIVANDLTITGSIGVIMHSYNYRGLMDKVGVRPEVFKSGKFKDMLSGEKNLNDMTPEEKAIYLEERKMVQSLIDETYGKFKSVVQKGRDQAAALNNNEGRKLVKNWGDYADGRILSGTQALELGFVDELGTFQDAVKRAKKIAGISEATLIQYQAPFDIMNMFRLFGKTEAPAIKVDMGFDMPKLQVGRLYFISTTVIR